MVLSRFRRLGMLPGMLTGEVVEDIHALMWDADNINPILAHEIENDVGAFRVAVITVTDLRTRPPRLGFSASQENRRSMAER